MWEIRRGGKFIGITCIIFTNADHYVPLWRPLLADRPERPSPEYVYSGALSGYRIVQGPSSKWCRELEGRLQELRVASVESDACEDEFTGDWSTRVKAPYVETFFPQAGNVAKCWIGHNFLVATLLYTRTCKY
ncbi:hypothetical protein F5884DRAFT_776842 [Xylogone sp. PMI_703]|nr:hypothetical protein F5884DRAFT_776842 [Xylogone sp. PMI_703]